jgi:hypothetical protein
MSFLIVFLGGGLGSACRYGVGPIALRLGFNGFPLGTLAINVVGSFLMGLVVEYFALHGSLPHPIRLPDSPTSYQRNYRRLHDFLDVLAGGSSPIPTRLVVIGGILCRGLGNPWSRGVGPWDGVSALDNDRIRMLRIASGLG